MRMARNAFARMAGEAEKSRRKRRLNFMMLGCCCGVLGLLREMRV
jgi:hypothetical protein